MIDWSAVCSQTLQARKEETDLNKLEIIRRQDEFYHKLITPRPRETVLIWKIKKYCASGTGAEVARRYVMLCCFYLFTPECNRIIVIADQSYFCYLLLYVVLGFLPTLYIFYLV